MPTNANGRAALLDRQHWMTFLLPFLVYMGIGALEPSPGGCAICYAHSYPIMYAIKIGLTLVAVAFVWPGYRQFALRVTPLAILVGIIGGPLWIALAAPGWERLYVWPLVQKAGLGFLAGGDRPAFNPLDPANNLATGWAWAFLAVRFFGLVAVVPLIEELFLRGFVMRFVIGARLVESPFRHGQPAGHRTGHRRPDALSSRAVGRRRLVLDGHLADAADAKRLGLRRCSRDHKSDSGNLRSDFGKLAADVAVKTIATRST